MAENLTPQQKSAVENRGGRLLVSAAAGSGKTKVLVDRLLLHLTQGGGKRNIDDFLIITYTKAAASELRGKIAAKLNQRLSEDPGNKFLQRQLQRLYLTQISTVHSFCANILRENAYRLDIPSDFRMVEEQESNLLQMTVLDKVLDHAYAEADPDFITFIDSQELGRDDWNIPQIILQIYQASRCHIDPDGWLDQCLQDSDVGQMTDASETVWGKYLIDVLHSELDLHIQAMEKCAQLAEENGTMGNAPQNLYENVGLLKELRGKCTWDEIVPCRKLDFGTLRFPKDISDIGLQSRIKTIRNKCKKQLEKLLKPFADRSCQVLQDLQSCSAAAKGLINLVKKFAEEYDSAKKTRHILDYSDLEHKTLDLFRGKDRSGITALAEEIGARYHEIMVDEYQDSNAVQDGIFSALTEKKQNCFMVGDVKQSIYQFRLADPGIFLDKYNRYVSADKAQPGEGRKIMLSKNFRSAGQVISAVNDVFSYCMSPDVGGLYYGENERLYGDENKLVLDEPEVELCAVDVQHSTYVEEAEYTAKRIVELLDGKHMIREKDSLRPIAPDDIVILLRAPSSSGGEFQYALEQRGLKVNSGTGADLLQTEEVCFVRAMLQIIDNPLQDIPLITAMTSRILCFDMDELSEIRAMGSRKKPIYDSMRKSESAKVQNFLAMLNRLREAAKLCSLSQLIEEVVRETRLDSIYASFPEGKQKTDNLQAFYQLVASCQESNQKELAQFLEHLAALEEKGVSVSAEQGSSGAITILSIHKSKGLEYPVVFLCGLSRMFNQQDSKSPVLCHKDLGIGLNCVDLNKRIRYASVAKKAIASRIVSSGVSEELRVLYVAMTRAKDRLIMTYASPKMAGILQDIAERMDICDRRLLTAHVNCPGNWILMTALQRMESGALFELGDRPDHLTISEHPWRVTVENIQICQDNTMPTPEQIQPAAETTDISVFKNSLNYVYPYLSATQLPSKQTATQMKGRQKDQEVAENTGERIYRNWRVPSFEKEDISGGVTFGNTVHSVMQYICYERCGDIQGIQSELLRLSESGMIDERAICAVDPQMLLNFFTSSVGMKLRQASNVLREFKFSILDKAPDAPEDQILLQGVVDCAIIEPDGITVLDFKTDRVTADNLDAVAASYEPQVKTYAKAMSRIFCKEVKSSQLYFFRADRFVSVL